MKKTRFTEAQIMGILRQMENGAPVSELCREHGMSSATVYKWRAKYGGMDASLISEMKAMAEEVQEYGTVAIAAGGEFDGANVERRRIHRQMHRCRHWRRPCGPCLRACHAPSPKNLMPVLSTSRFNGPSARRSLRPFSPAIRSGSGARSIRHLIFAILSRRMPLARKPAWWMR